MTQISYAAATVPVRADLAAAHEHLWQNLAEPGTWWTGAERVAIAAEVRTARTCALCTERKGALSPSAVQGQHDTHDADGVLPAPVVEMIHRVTTDPGRLTRDWYDRLHEDGLQDTQYVETLGVVVRTVSIDSFCRGVGVPMHPLPSPVPGEPSRRRPAQARPEGAWVPTIPTGSETGPDADLYWGQPAPNVLRAMSLVPAEVRASLGVLMGAHYLSVTQGLNPASNGGRDLSRPQMELLASRVSALNECFY